MAVGYIKRLAGPYTGAGTTALPFGFKIFEPTDVYVAVAANSADQPVHLVYGTDYTVFMNESQDAAPGGTVTLVAALSGTQVAVVGSALAYTQETQLTNYNRFPPEIVNTALDRIVVQIQQIIEQLGRVLKVPETADITPEELIKSLQDAAETATVIAKGYAEAAKKSEEKTAEYAEAATVIAPFKDEIKTVADNIDNVVTVGQSIEDVKKVSEVNAEVAAVGTGIQSVKTVADAQNLASVHIVAGISEHVVRTSEISAAVVTVSNASDHVANVSRNMDDVKNVSNGMPDIQTVAGDLSGGKCTQQKFTAGRLTDVPAQDCTVEGGNIKTVADHIASVDKVAGTVDDGTLEKAANSIETTAENVSRAEAAQTAAEKAQTAAESAKAAADTSANNSSGSAVLSKKWATQTTAPVEGELYGAKYYADKAQGAQAESANILGAVQQAGTDAVAAITSEGTRQTQAVSAEGAKQVQAVRSEGATQTANAKAQADAASASATSAASSKTAAEKAQGAAESAKTSAESAKTAAETAKGQAQTAATTATTQATAAAASAERAKGYAEQASTGQMQANWTETNPTSKAFILNKPDIYTKAETYPKTELYTKGEVDTKLETSSAGADSVQLCQQLIGFYNGVTGEALDYRDYLDHKPQEYLDAFYAFGVGYEGVVNGANA